MTISKKVKPIFGKIFGKSTFPEKQKIHANRKVCMDSTFSIGGDKRDRTADLLNAIQALSQLSYAPKTIKIIIENSLTCQYNCKI